MGSTSSNRIIDMDVDDWVEMDVEDKNIELLDDIDSRRLVENKLEELRLKHELDEFDYTF